MERPRLERESYRLPDGFQALGVCGMSGVLEVLGVVRFALSASTSSCK